MNNCDMKWNCEEMEWEVSGTAASPLTIYKRERELN